MTTRPWGEREDRGEITTEDEAMRHSRRNEIYRDVGSSERDPDDPGFIEIETFPMPSDGVLLLCSDGLTDLVGSAAIRAGVERYAPDFDAVARASSPQPTMPEARTTSRSSSSPDPNMANRQSKSQPERTPPVEQNRARGRSSRWAC